MEGLLRKHYIVALISTLFLVGACVIVVQFGDGMKKRQARVLDARDRIASFELNKKVLAEESIEMEQIKTKIETLEQYLVKEDTVPILLSDLEKLASTHHVDFSIVAVQTPKSGDSKKLVVNFDADGSLKNIEAFLQSIQSQAYAIRFTNFSLHDLGAETEVASSSETPPTPVKQETSSVASKWKLTAGIEILSY